MNRLNTMKTNRQITSAWIALGLGLACGAGRAAQVSYRTTTVEPGVTQYEFIIDNTGGAQAVAGLNVLRAGSAFDLPTSSAIPVPSGWALHTPGPGAADELGCFSLTTASDVPPGQQLAGFRFQSTNTPDCLTDFQVELLTAGGASLGFQCPVLTTNLGRPMLAVQHAGANVLLSWPLLHADYRLQMASDLRQPFWEDVPLTEANRVMVPLNVRQRFFRLVKP